MIKNIHSILAGLSFAHLIETDAGLFLVDAGSPGNARKVLRMMRDLGRDDLRLIFITHGHFDHYGSAAELRRVTGAPIAIHHADGEAMARGETPLGSVRGRGKMTKYFLPFAERILKPERTRADVEVKDGDQFKDFGLNATVVHTPGHTPGSSSLFVEDRLIFVGDLLSSVWRLKAQRYYATDWSQIAVSLDRLKTLEPEWIYTGHGRRINGVELQRVSAPTI